MRIIGGTLKGRKLSGFKNPHIRPMTDKVKESVFSILSPYLSSGWTCLDLFSGTGNLALESLSRGARLAHAVDEHPQSIALINKNRDMLGCSRVLTSHKKDVFQFLKKSRLEPFSVIFVDPPFSLKCGEAILETIVNSHLYVKGTIVVVETSKQEILAESYSCFSLFLKRDFGDKSVWFYRAI